MKSNKKFFGKYNSLPVDKFFLKVLYDKKFGYYSTKKPFGIQKTYRGETVGSHEGND